MLLFAAVCFHLLSLHKLAEPLVEVGVIPHPHDVIAVLQSRCDIVNIMVNVALTYVEIYHFFPTSSYVLKAKHG